MKLQAMEKDVKSKLEPLFEDWRDDADGGNVQWMKAGDVVRAMKDTLKTCEEEERGEVKAHPDGVHFLADDGRSIGGQWRRRRRCSRCRSPQATPQQYLAAASCSLLAARC